MLGPLQLLVIGFDEDKYARDIIVELKNLRKEQIIRLFDLLYIIKHEDGTIASKEVDDLQAEEQREFGTLVKSLIGLASKGEDHINADEVAASISAASSEAGFTESEIQEVANQLPNGSSAIFVVFEHTWARGVKAAMLKAGGSVRAQGMINPDTLQTASNELASVLEAIDKAEVASMEKMAAVMAEARAREEEARQHAADAQTEAEAMEAAAAAALATAALRAEEAEKAVAEALTHEEEARQRAAEVEAEAAAMEEAARLHAAEVKAEAEAVEDEAFAQAEAVRRAAKRQEEKAQAEAAEAVRQAEEMEAEAVLRAVNAMVSAQIIEEAAVREALKAVISANVIEAGAAQRAAKTLSSSRYR